MKETVEQHADRAAKRLESLGMVVDRDLYVYLLRDAKNALNGYPCEIILTPEELQDITSNIDTRQNLS